MEQCLSLQGIHKSFVGVYALKGVDFSIRRGEIHCLVGENGSGKSTLIKIISGVLAPDRGEIQVAGQRLDHLGSGAAIKHGIHVIYQDLSLFPNLTVAENIAISELEASGRALVRWGDVRRIARSAMSRIKVSLDLEERVGELPIGLQQIVAICRALTSELQLLILDEPTASLTKRDIDSLLTVVRDLQGKGIAVLFVSHKLSEVFAVAERITVLRDGETVATMPCTGLTDERLVTLMTGKTLKETLFPGPGMAASKILEVRGLSKRNNFRDISFDLRAGEILGITGLIGSGRTELALALFGISPADSGTVVVDGTPVHIGSVHDAVRAGIAYVPENRLVQGLFMKRSVAENVIAAILSRLLTHLRLIDQRRRKQDPLHWIEALEIKVSNPAVAAQTLSGGNQQRVVISKWLASEPKVLILDGPTVGIDVLAKTAIHSTIRGLAARGIGVLLISDEIPEVLTNSNRILLMRSGRIHRQVQAQLVTAEELQRLIDTGQ
jgi:simple sugar transport system ATP-binding protein